MVSSNTSPAYIILKQWTSRCIQQNSFWYIHYLWLNYYFSDFKFLSYCKFPLYIHMGWWSPPYISIYYIWLSYFSLFMRLFLFPLIGCDNFCIATKIRMEVSRWTLMDANLIKIVEIYICSFCVYFFGRGVSKNRKICPNRTELTNFSRFLVPSSTEKYENQRVQFGCHLSKFQNRWKPNRTKYTCVIKCISVFPLKNI